MGSLSTSVPSACTDYFICSSQAYSLAQLKDISVTLTWEEPQTKGIVKDKMGMIQALYLTETCYQENNRA